MLDDAIERSQQIYNAIGGKWNDQKKTWRLPGGGRLRFRPLERVQDADKYQGQNVTDACIEEAGNYPDPQPIDRINGVLRSASGVPTQLVLTGNPGGTGQNWIKVRYIDPCPTGMKILKRELPNGETHKYVFIPSRLQNNRVLMHNDPGYINRLYLVGSDQLVQAWLDGDWSVVAGAYFPEFGMSRHVIPPQILPSHWLRFRAMDWGSAKPFSIGWYAVSDGELSQFPRGALIKYREWYGIKTDRFGNFEPNVGLKLTAEEVADGIVKRTGDENITYSVLDPAAFSEDGGPCIAERMARRKAVFRRADNARVARSGSVGGWDQLRARLVGSCARDEISNAVQWDTGQPMIYFFSTCVHTIRTLPSGQHDPDRPEDLDSDGEDHALDETRYAGMSRPWVAPVKHIAPPDMRPPMTIGELIKLSERSEPSRKRI